MASPQAPPSPNSSVPGRGAGPPINRGCIQQEGAWASSALKPGETSGSCQLEVGEVREVGEVGRFLPELPDSRPGWAQGSPDTVCTGLVLLETRQSTGSPSTSAQWKPCCPDVLLPY